MSRGLTAFRAVFWATVLAVAASFLRRDTALGPRRLGRALAAGARGVLPVVATTATAGIIVGVVTLTGLGLKVAGVIVALAGRQPRADGPLCGAGGVGAWTGGSGDGVRTSSPR